MSSDMREIRSSKESTDNKVLLENEISTSRTLCIQNLSSKFFELIQEYFIP